MEARDTLTQNTPVHGAATSKIGVRDLINVGLFSALYFVMFVISGMSGLIPIMTIFYPALLAILGGIPCILFYTKVRTFGLVTLMGVLMGLVTLLMGYGPYALATGVICGLLADLVMRAGSYKSWKHVLAGYCIFSEWAVGSQLIMFIFKDAYLAGYVETQGADYVAAVSGLLQDWMIVVSIVAVVIGAVIGAYLGKRVLKKHFERAGIA